MILVTGHRGFVGGYVKDAIGEYAGYDILDGDDIRDAFRLDKAIRDNKIDTIIHCAARTGVRTSARFPEEYISTNIEGTRILLDVAKDNNVKHVIYFSSSSIYGGQEPPNTEDCPMRPDSIYGMTKAAAEMLCAMSPVPTTIVRPFTLYGKNGRKDQVVYKWLTEWGEGKPVTFYGDGSTQRGYTHVEDLLSGVHRIIERGAPAAGNDTYNLGGSEVISLRALAEIFKSELNDITFNAVPLPSYDVPANWATTDKARQELGWQPTRSFEAEMRSIIKDFRDSRPK